MNYLFFDIECANCDQGKGKICSFGYTLTNEKFDVVESEDILINPDAPFHLTGRRDKRDIMLGYSKEEFVSSPKFPEFYEKIFSLINNKENLVIGYAVVNDVNFLQAECERYSLDMPDFTYYDVQLIYSDFKGVKGVVGLERASAEFGAVIKECHVSKDDAENTMLIAKGICEKLAIPFDCVLALSYRAKGEIKDGEKSFNSKTPKKKEYENKKQEIFNRFPAKSKEIEENRNQSFLIHSGQNRILHNYDSGESKTSTIGELLSGLKLEI
ncbi:MAG: hypothetical protein IKC83_04680 [Clostridia bacterium]|nr:hypothetical protein [Clostridia bacterium]